MDRCSSLQRETAASKLRRSLLFLIVVTVVTAYFSQSYFQADEHFQIIEFVSYKLGWTAASDLPWEFRARIRSWMQPFLYFLVAKPLTIAGVEDPFAISFALRLATGLASLVAFATFAEQAMRDFASEHEQRVYAASLPLFGFLPYLFVRTSSEAMSAAFFTAGFALVMRHARSARAGRLLGAGILVGMAFECRYQTGLLIGGLYLWLAIVERMPFASLWSIALGSLIPVALALPIDRWGYGVWCFPPWDYFVENIVHDTAARLFGSDPLYGYLYLIPWNVFLPVATLVLVAMFVAWARNPWHVITWTTAPFVLVQSLLAHKEERFLFPIASIATTFPVLAFAPSQSRNFPVFERLWELRRSIAMKAVAALSLTVMALSAVNSLGFNTQIGMARYLDRHFPAGLSAYTFDNVPFTLMPFYNRHPIAMETLRSGRNLAHLIGDRQIYVISTLPWLAARDFPASLRQELVYSELPFAGYPAVVNFARWFKRVLFPHITWATLYRVERKDRGRAD